MIMCNNAVFITGVLRESHINAYICKRCVNNRVIGGFHNTNIKKGKQIKWTEDDLILTPPIYRQMVYALRGLLRVF